MLYELRPDLFPSPWLTDAELVVWSMYYEERNERDHEARHGRS